MTRGRDEKKDGSAAELLADWRGAERDTAAAKVAATVANLAARSAIATEEAALATEDAALAALDAATRAKSAADRARKAASQAAEAAQILNATAEGDQVRAGLVLTDAELAEKEARDRFYDAVPTDERRGP